jgi:hypothetical protein
VRELARRVPGVEIGTYCGERKLVARGGINVVTYAMLGSRHRARTRTTPAQASRSSHSVTSASGAGA